MVAADRLARPSQQTPLIHTAWRPMVTPSMVLAVEAHEEPCAPIAHNELAAPSRRFEEIAVRLQVGNLDQKVEAGSHEIDQNQAQIIELLPVRGAAPRRQLTARGPGPGPVFEADVGAQVLLPTRWHHAERQPPLADVRRSSAFLYARSGCGLRRQSPRV
ncbi:hypothetical protein AB0N81_12955 [Streptomyces sp. NPDC093510]|uniref:hypothetical protein n=1 Tax=Streptomyces sp. NPDC093510 TaxID=3155199 RepID=UPI003418F81B